MRVTGGSEGGGAAGRAACFGAAAGWGNFRATGFSGVVFGGSDAPGFGGLVEVDGGAALGSAGFVEVGGSDVLRVVGIGMLNAGTFLLGTSTAPR